MEVEVSESETPAAWHLMGAYLNQDWSDDFEDEWAAVDAFVAESPSIAPLLPAEIDSVLASVTSEGGLEAWITEQGASYRPVPGATYRAFLQTVSERVRRATLHG